MRRIMFFSTLVAIAFFLRPLQAQNQHGWNFQIDLIRMENNFDQHMLSECMLYNTLKFRPDGLLESIIDVGMHRNKIVLTLTRKTIIMPEISYTWKTWRVGARVWYFNAIDKKFGNITASAPIDNGDSTITFFRSGTYMWSHYILSLINMLEASGWSPVDWWTENSLKLWTAEMYIAQTLSRKFAMRIGIKVADIVNKQKIGQKQRVYIDPYFNYIWDNHITLSQKAQSRSRVIGPYFGLEFNTKYIQGLIQGAPLFTLPFKEHWTINSGHWDDTDDADIRLIETNSLYSTIYYDGDFPFNLKTRNLVPQGELNLKLTYPFHYKDIIVEFGVGFFGSIFCNVPVAPVWQLPAAWTWAQSTRWETQTKNLKLYGWTISMSINWEGGK